MNSDTYKVQPVKEIKEIHASVPGSKSITNRALLIAALAKGETRLHHVLFSDDSRNFIQALIDLGFDVTVDEEAEEVTILGLGGKLPVQNKDLSEIYVGSAGTAARFLTAFLGLSQGRYLLNSSEQMKKRPMKELLDAMFELGASIEFKDEINHFPFVIGNDGMIPNEVTIDIDKSSQFLSALLISSVLMKEDFQIHVKGNHGMAYVTMTIAMMKQFGVNVELIREDTFLIRKEAFYVGRDYFIEPDLSAACYFYGMGAILNVPALVEGVKKDSLQGDLQFVYLLEKMGCQIKETESRELKLYPSQDGLKGGDFDLSSFSDQALTLAAIAPFCRDSVTIQNVGHIRLQECDRIQAILTNLQTMGIEASEEDGNIRIMPGKAHGGLIHTYEDHRVAMSFTLPGLLVPDIIIENPMCCRKTFEKFFEVLEIALIA